jgi:hypothetical protein
MLPLAAIPPLAWIFIALIVILFLITNFILVAMLSAKKTPGQPARRIQARGFTRTSQDLARIEKVLRDPFAAERGQLNELSRLVERLPHPSDQPEDADPEK